MSVTNYTEQKQYLNKSIIFGLIFWDWLILLLFQVSKQTFSKTLSCVLKQNYKRILLKTVLFFKNKNNYKAFCQHFKNGLYRRKNISLFFLWFFMCYHCILNIAQRPNIFCRRKKLLCCSPELRLKYFETFHNIYLNIFSNHPNLTGCWFVIYCASEKTIIFLWGILLTKHYKTYLFEGVLSIV